MQTIGSLTTSEAQPAVLTYYLKTTQPVGLLDLTASLTAIGEQFRRFMREDGADIAEEDIRLYIKEVREGSVVADLIALAQQLSFVSPDTAWVCTVRGPATVILRVFQRRQHNAAKSRLRKKRIRSARSNCRSRCEGQRRSAKHNGGFWRGG
jgi:hypothetical protein